MNTRNLQLVVLATTDGTAESERLLKRVWKERLKQVAPHYKVVCVAIKKRP